MSTKHRQATLAQLARLGINDLDSQQLCRISATLHTWHEHECNGEIQLNEESNRYSWYNTYSGKRVGPCANRYTPAVTRAGAIANKYGLTAYVQGDPRGCALYLVRPGDVPAGAEVESYYSRGIAVVPR